MTSTWFRSVSLSLSFWRQIKRGAFLCSNYNVNYVNYAYVPVIGGAHCPPPESEPNREPRKWAFYSLVGVCGKWGKLSFNIFRLRHMAEASRSTVPDSHDFYSVCNLCLYIPTERQVQDRHDVVLPPRRSSEDKSGIG